MAHSASLLNAKSEFDSFLFAPVGEDRKGTMVSVLTAFARLDFDPWQQANDFARLPKETARTRLAEMIERLPGMSPARAEPLTVAERLVALLPRSAGPATPSGKAWRGLGQPSDFSSPRFILWILLFITLSFASQLFMASQQPAPPANTNHTQASSTIGPPKPIVDQGITADVPTTEKRVSQPAAPATPVRKPLFGK